MTDQTTQGAGSQAASGQSSSSSTGQQASSQAALGAQGQGSDQGQNNQGQSGQAASNAAPQRPSYVLESEWDSTSNSVRQDVFAQRINELAAFKAEQDVRKNSLPTSPDKYEIRLPADFKAPEGVKFEFDPNSADLKRARELAHARGLDQDAFADFLGVYAANKIGETQQIANARNTELAKLGSAAQARIDAIETWLKARTGSKADVLVAQLKNFPHSGMVEMFEDVIRQFSNQGSASFTQSGRQQQESNDKIPGYENMNFLQRRAAQDALAGKTIVPTGRAAASGR